MAIDWQLPPNWSTSKLGALAPEESVQIRPADSPTTIFNYWGLEAIEKGQYEEPKPNFVAGSQVASTCVRFGPQHVLYSKLRPYLNKVIVPSVEGVGTTEWIVLRPDPAVINRHFLAYALRTQSFVAYASESSTGARMPRARKEVLRDATIAIPYPDDPARSLETQRRIVARIEALFAELRECRTLHQAVVEDTNRLMGAVLAEVFPDPTNRVPDGWFVKGVGEISRPPQYGYTQSARKESVGPQFLRITDIQDGKVDWPSVPYCECNDAARARYQLADGDIVFARSGATTGKTFLVKNPPDAVFASYLIRLRVVNDATPDFVWWFFQSPYYWKQIILRGGAQPNMNAQTLKSIRVPIPTDPLLQSQIVSRLNAARSEIREMQAVSDADTKLLSDMEEAILTQAFRGGL